MTTKFIGCTNRGCAHNSGYPRKNGEPYRDFSVNPESPEEFKCNLKEVSLDSLGNCNQSSFVEGNAQKTK